jgi:hypothetical protein
LFLENFYLIVIYETKVESSSAISRFPRIIKYFVNAKLCQGSVIVLSFPKAVDGDMNAVSLSAAQ